MRTLKDQVQENKDLNQTLRLELTAHEKLEKWENQGMSTCYQLLLLLCWTQCDAKAP
jgi:hypothetical protein